MEWQGCKLSSHDHDTDFCVIMVGWVDVPDSDRGDISNSNSMKLWLCSSKMLLSDYYEILHSCHGMCQILQRYDTQKWSYNKTNSLSNLNYDGKVVYWKGTQDISNAEGCYYVVGKDGQLKKWGLVILHGVMDLGQQCVR